MTRTMSRGRDERVKAQVLVPVADTASDAGSDAASNALWELSVAKDAQRKREDLNALRYQYHIGQAERHKRTLSQLITHHQNAALELLERKES